MIRAMAPELDLRSDPIELLDAGEGRRLERFGGVVVDRPAPSATGWKLDHALWRSADLRFDAKQGWTTAAGSHAPLEHWSLDLGGLTMELRPVSSGGVGLYPEHLANRAHLVTEVVEREARAGRAPTVLHLFAHTGLLTLAAARAGASVAHVDSARSVVAWARRNAELSGLADRPIRWLVDDAAAFVAREARRGRRYDGIVLDPPSYGHARGKRWRLEDDLMGLIEGCAAILADDGFMLLTAHTTGLDDRALVALTQGAIPSARQISASSMDLVATSGAELRLGWSVRLTL